MTNRKAGTVFPVLILIAVVAGCAGRQHVNTTLAPEVLFERALTDLHAHKWTSAQEQFERFVLQYPSHPRAQEARFHEAEAYFGKKEYITAADEFSRLANDYPAGPFADDARYKVCESYYRLSPRPELDQQYTVAAIDHCQSLIAYYATSDFVPKAQTIVTELRTKLADKDFLNAEHYFKLGAYDSAIIYYEKTLRDYADTVVAPRSLKRLLETYTKLNYKEEAEAAKQRLLKDYPNSPEAKQLQQPPPSAS